MFYIDNIDLLKESVVVSRALFELGTITASEYMLKLYQACELFDISYWVNDLETNYKHLMARVGVQEKANEVHKAITDFGKNLITEEDKILYHYLFLSVQDDFLAFIVHHFYKYLLKHHKASASEFLWAVWEPIQYEDFVKIVFKGNGELDQLKVLDYFKLGGVK